MINERLLPASPMTAIVPRQVWRALFEYPGRSRFRPVPAAPGPGTGCPAVTAACNDRLWRAYATRLSHGRRKDAQTRREDRQREIDLGNAVLTPNRKGRDPWHEHERP